MPLNPFRKRNREHRTKPTVQDREPFSESEQPAELNSGGESSVRSVFRDDLAEDLKDPEFLRDFFETRFPAELHPNECVFDHQTRCVREDHQHDGDNTDG